MMSKFSEYKSTVLVVQFGTVLMLIFTIVFGSLWKPNVLDTTPQLEKFRNKYHDARAASDLKLQDTLVDGFVSHALAVNSAVLEAAGSYHKLISVTCYGLIILNLFAMGVLIKMRPTRQS